MADRTAGARAVSSLADFARSLVPRRTATTAPNASGPTSLLASEPKRLISDPKAFFGAGEPLAPIAPPETAGRQFDYPYAYNRQARPRSTEGVSFAQLRALADAHDLTRLAIETRKDQMERVEWEITRVDGEEGEAPDAITQFVRRPDRDNDWATWLRMLLEEMFVPDATSLYLRRTLGGAFYAAELIDGTTITPLVDDTGRRPMAPAPAYQQILKGVAAVDYTRDELLYLPRNPRVHKLYGYSPVEQIIVTINLALRRQTHQLAYYDDSNMPPALANVPEDWTAEMIKEFQAYFDYLLTGDAAERSKLRFVPGKTQVQLLQTAPLFDAFAEEWLARVVCYAFSLPPTAFARQTNRATAETVQDAAEDEGLAPLMRWVKGVMDRLIQAPEALNQPAWQFSWKLERPLQPETQAAIDVQYIAAGVRSADDVAQERFNKPAPKPAPEPTTPASGTDPNATEDPKDPKDPNTPDAQRAEAAKAADAAGRSLRRDRRWY